MQWPSLLELLPTQPTHRKPAIRCICCSTPSNLHFWFRVELEDRKPSLHLNAASSQCSIGLLNLLLPTSYRRVEFQDRGPAPQGLHCTTMLQALIASPTSNCRVEYEDREPDQRLLAALEAYGKAVLCTSPCSTTPGPSAQVCVHLCISVDVRVHVAPLAPLIWLLPALPCPIAKPPNDHSHPGTVGGAR